MGKYDELKHRLLDHYNGLTPGKRNAFTTVLSEHGGLNEMSTVIDGHSWSLGSEDNTKTNTSSTRKITCEQTAFMEREDADRASALSR